MIPRSPYGVLNPPESSMSMLNQQFPQGFQQFQYLQKLESPQDQIRSLDLSQVSHSKCDEEEEEGKSAAPWHRIKWTDAMVRLLLTIVSYIGEDAITEEGCSSRRKFSLLQKKGKWKSVSRVMGERGFFVSPQQCEDKFNDLNKRYKRLTEILGRGTSCSVVENPSLLEMMDHISDKAKDDVRKILGSKHLFYEELCSYHNCNRLHLPPDPSVQRSLQLALRNDGEEEEDLCLEEDGEGFSFPKRVKTDMDVEEFDNFCGRVDFVVLPEGSEAARVQEQRRRSRLLQLQEQQLQIRAQMAELERKRAKWRQLNLAKERELERTRTENERMRFENDQLALHLKYKELKNAPSCSS